MERFVSLALEQNLDISQAAARVAQPRASWCYADAALLPAANVSVSAASAYQSVETPLGQVVDATPRFDRSGSSYEVLDADSNLRQARYAKAQAQAEAARAAIASFRALGGGWDAENASSNRLYSDLSTTDRR